MKYLAIAVLAAFVCCSYADLKSDILDRATLLEARAKNESARLTADGKTELAARITAEEQRLEKIANELKTTTGEEALRLLEQELVAIEFRFTNELRRINNLEVRYRYLEREAQVLRTDVADIRALLVRVTGRYQALALNISNTLARQEERILEVAGALSGAQNEERIIALERELRAIEAVVNRELDNLRIGTIPTPAPVSTARSSVAPVSTARSTVAPVSTARSSVAPVSTARSTARSSAAF